MQPTLSLPGKFRSSTSTALPLPKSRRTVGAVVNVGVDHLLSDNANQHLHTNANRFFGNVQLPSERSPGTTAAPWTDRKIVAVHVFDAANLAGPLGIARRRPSKGRRSGAVDDGGTYVGQNRLSRTHKPNNGLAVQNFSLPGSGYMGPITSSPRLSTGMRGGTAGMHVQNANYGFPASARVHSQHHSAQVLLKEYLEEEFLRHIMGDGDDMDKELKSLLWKVRNELKTYFDKADTNSVGKISPVKVRDIFLKLGRELADEVWAVLPRGDESDSITFEQLVIVAIHLGLFFDTGDIDREVERASPWSAHMDNSASMQAQESRSIAHQRRGAEVAAALARQITASTAAVNVAPVQLQGRKSISVAWQTALQTARKINGRQTSEAMAPTTSAAFLLPPLSPLAPDAVEDEGASLDLAELAAKIEQADRENNFKISPTILDHRRVLVKAQERRQSTGRRPSTLAQVLKEASEVFVSEIEQESRPAQKGSKESTWSESGGKDNSRDTDGDSSSSSSSSSGSLRDSDDDGDLDHVHEDVRRASLLQRHLSEGVDMAELRRQSLADERLRPIIADAGRLRRVSTTLAAARRLSTAPAAGADGRRVSVTLAPPPPPPPWLETDLEHGKARRMSSAVEKTLHGSEPSAQSSDRRMSSAAPTAGRRFSSAVQTVTASTTSEERMRRRKSDLLVKSVLAAVEVRRAEESLFTLAAPQARRSSLVVSMASPGTEWPLSRLTSKTTSEAPSSGK